MTPIRVSLNGRSTVCRSVDELDQEIEWHGNRLFDGKIPCLSGYEGMKIAAKFWATTPNDALVMRLGIKDVEIILEKAI